MLFRSGRVPDGAVRRRGKAVFHVTTRPPVTAGICDHCGGGLVQREDDRAESVRVRMQAYQASTWPLTEYYSRAGKFVRIQASGTPEEVLERTLATLSEERMKDEKRRV